MYLKTLVPIPREVGKIVLLKSGNTTYVYCQTERIYDREKKYTAPKRVTIGKVSLEDSSMMYPNSTFFQLFPDVPIVEEEPKRSCAIRIGNYAVIRRLAEDLGLKKVLSHQFSEEDIGLLLDFAAYTIVAESNVGQYYPDYAYEHAAFTSEMKVYSDSTLSKWLHDVTEDQIIQSVSEWNRRCNHKDPIYISYDSTNKNSHAGDVELVEYGHPKEQEGAPIVNYSLAYDTKERLPAFYESYPGSITDVSQLERMIEKARGYGYKNIGFILDRGYFSKRNIVSLDENGYPFVIMLKGYKKLVNDVILSRLHSFEKKSSAYIEEYDTFGTTVECPLFEKDRSRFIHLYHSVSKESSELSRLNDDLRRMKKELKKAVGKFTIIPKSYEEYFEIFYEDIEIERKKSKKETDNPRKAVEIKKKFIAYQEKEDYVEKRRNLCGYYAIVTSAKMSAGEALVLYKSRDGSEKLFRGDKSYLGNKTLRVHSTESTETKIFVEFIALIIRSRIYACLHDLNRSLNSKLNYLSVPAAVRELEKITMIMLPDGRYHLSYAVTKTQKTILSAFGMTEDDVKAEAGRIADSLFVESKEVG